MCIRDRDTLTHSTAGSIATNYVVEGSAKAWANFDGTGTASIRDSFNAASLTDNGTGTYSINFSNSFSNSDYSSIGFSYPHSSWNQISHSHSYANQTTSLTKFWSGASTAGTLNDTSLHNHSVHGDLA